MLSLCLSRGVGVCCAALLPILLISAAASVRPAMAQSAIPSLIDGTTHYVTPGDPSVVPGGGTQITPTGVLEIDDHLVNPGETLLNDGSVHNRGRVENHGAFENDNALLNQGQFDNYGVLRNDWAIDHQGTLINYSGGLVANSGSFGGYGSIENAGRIDNGQLFSVSSLTNQNGGEIENALEFTIGDSFDNAGTFRTSGLGSVVNAFSTTIDNQGLIDVDAASRFDHTGSVFSNGATGQVINQGEFGAEHMWNDGLLDNSGQAVISGSYQGLGEVRNHGTLHFDTDYAALGGDLRTGVGSETRFSGAEVSSFGMITNAGHLIRGGAAAPGWVHSGEVENSGVFELQGAFDHQGGRFQSFSGARIDNRATYANYALLDDFGDFHNRASGTFVNEGTYFKLDGDLRNAGVIENRGQVLLNALETSGRFVNDGTYRDRVGATLDATGSIIENRGQMLIHGDFQGPSRLENHGLIEYHAGQSLAAGFITGDGSFRNLDATPLVIEAFGALAPGGLLGDGLATMDFEGAFELDGDNTLVLEIDLLANDRLEVLGTQLPSVLKLGGEIDVHAVGALAGGNIEAGMSFDLVEAMDGGAMLIGAFDALIAPLLPGGLHWELRYGSMIGGHFVPVGDPASSPFDIVRLAAIPEPGTALMLGVGLFVIGRRSRPS